MDPSDVIIAAARSVERTTLADLFRGRGDRVLPAEDAATARAAILSAEARFLLLDLRLPGLDAERLSRALAPEEAGLETLDLVERNHIARVLGATGGNRSRAARALGISRSTLLAKIRRYGLD